MYRRKSASAGTVQQRLQQKFGLTLSKSTVRRAAQRKGHSPKKKERQCILAQDLEDEVLHFIGRLNANNLPVLRERTIAMLNHLLLGRPEVAQRFKGNKVGEKWWYRFLKKNKNSLRMCNITTIQTDRLKWSTPENVKAWYDIVKETALCRGLAVVNPDYSVSEPDSPEILWKHSDRVMSCDETGLPMDMTENKKDRANKSVTVRGRKCKVIAQKSSYRFSAIGGSTASAQSLPPMLIFPGTSFTLGRTMGGPKSSTGLPATIHHSDSGSESSVVSAGQQSDGEHSDSEQSEELFFPAKIVDSCTCGKSFCYRVRWAGFGPAHDTWEPHSSLGKSGNRPLIMQYQQECKQWPPLKKWSDVQQPVTV